MTQPAVIPATPDVMTKKDILTVNGLVKWVADRSSCEDPGRLPRGYLKTWFPRRTAPELAILIPAIEAGPGTKEEKQARITQLVAEMEPTIFAPGRACPLNERLTVFAVYQNDECVRVYALELGAAEKPGERPVVAGGLPHRFKLSHHGAQFLGETMPMTTWVAELADEIDSLNQDTAFLDDSPGAPGPATPSGEEGEDDDEGNEE